MATLNFTQTLLKLNDSQECAQGAELLLRFSDTTSGEKTIVLTRENTNGTHVFGGTTVNSVNGAAATSLKFDDLQQTQNLTFNYTNDTGATDTYVEFRVLVFLTLSRFNVIKAEIPSINVLDFITVDCTTDTAIDPTPTNTETPTPTASIGYINTWREIPIYDRDNVLEVGDKIYETDLSDKYTIDELISLNSSHFVGSQNFYVKQIKENVIYTVQKDDNDPTAVQVIDFALCPTQTITPSHTATPSITPSFTPSNTETPTATPTQTPTNTRTSTPTQSPTKSNTPTVTSTCTSTPTPSQTRPQTGYAYYYVASTITGLCYGVESLIPSVLVYDGDAGDYFGLNNRVPKKPNPQVDSDWWTIDELVSKLTEKDQTFSELYIRRTVDTENRIIVVEKALVTNHAYVTGYTNDVYCPTQTPTPTITATATTTETPTRTPTQTVTPSFSPSPVLEKNIFVILNKPSEYNLFISDRSRYAHIFNSGSSFAVNGILQIDKLIYSKTNLEYDDVDTTSQYSLQDFRTILNSADNQIIYAYSLDSNKIYQLQNVQNSFVVSAELPIPSQTPTPSVTKTSTPTPTQTLTQTETPALTPLPTGTPGTTSTPTNSQTASSTPTNSVTPSNSSTPGNTPTATSTNTVTPTNSQTPTPDPTTTPTNTQTPMMLSKNIKIQLDRLEVGRKYEIDVQDTINQESEVRVITNLKQEDGKSIIVANSSDQNIAIRLEFSGSITIMNLSIKVKDSISGLVDHNTILVYTNHFQECY